MAIILMTLAGLLVAMSNLCLRRSIDAGGTSRTYLTILFTFAFFVAILLNPVRTGDYSWDPSMATFGLLTGVFLAGILIFIGKSLENGPAGLSIAIVNCSNVLPILILVLFFGSKFGFSYTLWHGLGSLLVIFGIFWAGWSALATSEATSPNIQRKWFVFVGICSLANVLYMVFLNWRALFIQFPGKEGLGFSIPSIGAQTSWFMPMVILSAALIQFTYFFITERRMPNKKELFYGVLGSLTNGTGTFLMIKGVEIATPIEMAMLFPIYSVMNLLACNLWGRMLYQEKVNWKANAVCVGGILIGTIDWTVLFG